MPKTKKKSIKQQQAADKLRKRKKVQYPHQSVTLQETGITTTCNSKLPVSPEPSTSQLSSESTDFSAVVEVQRFAPVLFSPEALTNLIGDSSTEIPDDIVSASLILMQMHATSDTNCSVGQYTPAELHLAGTGAIVLPQPHLDKDIINIHPLTRHWVCSYYKTSTKELFVFDSLRSDTHLQEVIDQLKYIFTEEIVSHVIYASVTQQGSEPLCGVMAIAFAFTCFLGDDPRNIHYDLTMARQHLKNCFSTSQIIRFPAKQPANSFDWIETYLDDQQNRDAVKLSNISNNVSQISRTDNDTYDKQKLIYRKSKQKCRADPVKRQRLISIDSESKRKSRADAVKRQKLNLLDSESKRKSRADPVKRLQMNSTNSALKRKSRADPVKRQKLKVIDSESKRKSRADPVKRLQMNLTNSALKQKSRADPVKRQKLNVIDSDSKRKSRADPVKRQKLNLLDSDSKQKSRADPVKHQKLNSIDSKSKRKSRADPVKRLQINLTNSSLKRKSRADPVKRLQLNVIDSESKRKSRADPVKRLQLNVIDSASKQKKRTVTSADQAILQFKSKCSEMPVFTCCVCYRLLFRKQVKHCNLLKFPDKELILRCIIVNNMHKPETTCDDDCKLCPKWICFTCNQHLLKKKIPSQASLNHLNFDEQPDCLKTLNNLEKHLVSPVIPFMKIVSLPKGSQKGIHGPVVCVPANISTTVETLPRSFNRETIIAVKLKRKLQYRGHHLFQQVTLQKIHEALLFLKRKSPHFTAIDINLDNVTSTTEQIFASDDTLPVVENLSVNEQPTNILDKSEYSFREPCVVPAVPNIHQHCPVTDHPDLASTSDGVSAISTDQPDQASTSDVVSSISTDHPDQACTSDVVSSISTDHPDLASTSEDVDDTDQDLHETSAPMVSCLQPEDLTQVAGTQDLPDSVFCIAPGQGSRPGTVFDMESRAFPYLFPTGKNTFSQKRNVKLGLNRYFNRQLFSADLRFASDPQYIFYSQYISELNTINSSVSIAMRKGSSGVFDQDHITATELKNPHRRQQILSSDKGYHFLSTARGSPPYWEKTLKDMFAMVKQLGIPTWFCSFSAADRRWPEIVTAICTQLGKSVPTDLDWSSYTQIINSNPVTACRMFQHRVLTFITDLILSSAHPIGQVEDFFYRTEFQSRGWPHVHCLFWCSDAPAFNADADSNEDFVKYIDKYITCSLPDEHVNPELYDIVKNVQMHSKGHSRTCKKGNRDCRFGFPRPICLHTFIATPKEPPENVSQAEYKKAAVDLLSAVSDAIKTCQEKEEVVMTEAELFQSLHITEAQYEAAHCAIARKNTVIYERKMNECWVNPYNTTLLRAWNVNIDIQPVLDAYSCIMYIVSYISKAERELGDLLRNAQKEAEEGHLEPVQQLRQLGNVYLHSREVCIMEAVYRVTGMHLKQSSRTVVFVPADRRSAKITKPLHVLKNDDDTDVWMTSLLDRYLARPTTDEFEQMSLAVFARDYTITSRRPINVDDVQEESIDNTDMKHYTLLNGLGTILKRSKPAVVRYMRVNKEKNSEDYYHNLIRMYFPHRCKDLQLTDAESFEHMFNQHSAVILPTISQFEKLTTDLDEAWRDLQQHGYGEDAWADVAPNQEPMRQEDEEELRIALQLFKEQAEEIPPEDIPDFSPNQQPVTSSHYTTPSQVISSNDHLEQKNRLRNMNQQQAQIFHFIKHWAHLKRNTDNVAPFYIFLTGGAGTGKSFTIKCIYHEINKILTRQSGNPDLPVVLLLSYTGTAAFNIRGQTIHSAFSINRTSSKVLSEDAANTLRSKLQDLQLLIIDEIFMVPSDLLELIHCRLQQIKQPFSSTACFGNVSILAVGDFYQIPPVAKKSLLSSNSSLTDLWSMFHIWELTEVVRQKGDRDFIDLLNRLRVRIKNEPLTAADKKFLEQRKISKTSPAYPVDALHIAPKHKQLKEHNDFMLEKKASTETLYTLEAADICHDNRTQRTYRRNEPVQSNRANLPAYLSLCCGTRVMLTMNIDVADGLTNGVMGAVTEIITGTSPLGLPEAICVLFQEERVGFNSRSRLRPPSHVHSSSTVIRPQTETIQTKPFQITRHQYPFMLAFIERRLSLLILFIILYCMGCYLP